MKGIKGQMDIREAVTTDNMELQQLQEKCPQGTTLVVSTVNSPDFFARAKVYEDFKVYVVCEDNRIIASAACGLHKALINNRIEKVGHEFQVFVDPEYRGRRIAGKLHQAHEEYLKKHGAILSYGLIVEGNKPSVRHFERQGFTHYSTLVMTGIAVYKKMPSTKTGNIRTMRQEDLPKVINLINNTWKGYEFYEPMQELEFNRLITRIPQYDYGNIFLIEEDEEIKACLGFWDWSKITEVTVKEYSLKMRVTAFLLDIARIFGPVPRLPIPGSLLKQIVLTPIGYNELKYITLLFKYINNQALSEEIEQIFFICIRGHPLLRILKGFIHIDTMIDLYVKPLRENLSLGVQPVFINGIDL